MKHRRLLWFIVAIVVVVAGGLTANSIHRARAAKSYINSTTPTIFFHGWGSSYRAERQMANYAKEQGITNTIVRANVAKSGKVTWSGTIKKGARNPIIEVNFANNKSVTGEESDPAKAYNSSSRYVKDVINSMQKKYHFTKINIVAHSMGNLQVAYYLKNNANDKNMPTLEHQVSIAGHYNGLTMEKGASSVKLDSQTGEPNNMLSEYKGVLPLRNNYPRSAHVLNIYGDIQDGRHSDSEVPVNSARSYKYLVASRAKSYREKQINGKQAQHSKLHENKQVDRILVNFLWSK